MKANRFFAIAALLAVGAALGAAGTRGSVSAPPGDGERRLVAEGMVKTAHVRDGVSWTSGPGSGLLSDERRYGKLYDDFLIVTKPQQKDFGTLVIPVTSLAEVHFEAK